MKKYLLILLLVAFTIPSIAFASWWNPFSWHWSDLFHKKEVVQTEEVKKLQEQIDELKKQQTTTQQPSIPAVKKDVPVIVPTAPKSNDRQMSNTNWEGYIPEYIQAKDSNVGLINKLESDLQTADEHISNLIAIVGTPPYQNAYGLQLAQNYMDTAKEFKASVDGEIISLKKSNEIVDGLITALHNKDEFSIDKSLTLLESNHSEWEVIVKQEVQLHAEELNSYSAFLKYNIEYISVQ